MLSRMLPVLVVLASFAVLAPLGNAAGGGETLQVAVPGAVSCVAADGTALGDDPTLRAGARIVCTVNGLGKTEMVDVTLDPGGKDLGTISTDAQGTATFDFTVPSASGKLSFTGETSKGVATFSFKVTGSVADSGPGGVSTGTGPNHLVFTGAYVFGPVLAGVLLIGGGAGLTMTYRRRRRHG